MNRGNILLGVGNGTLVSYDEEKCQLQFQNDTGIFMITPQKGGKEKLIFTLSKINKIRKHVVGLIFKRKGYFIATDTKNYFKGDSPYQCAAELLNKIKSGLKKLP